MYYLSYALTYGRKNKLSIDNFANFMLKTNGWETQFMVAKRTLNKYSTAVDDFALTGLFRSAHRPELIKRIVNLILVSRYLINHLNIKPYELRRVGFTGYEQNGKPCEAKLVRTYRKVLGEPYDVSGKRLKVITEFSTIIERVLEKQKETLGEKTGMQYQLCIASEEAGELAKEISKYYRNALVGNTDALAKNRETIVEELFDTLFTIGYVMETAGIITKDLNNFARLYLPHLYSKYIIDKARDMVER